MKLPPYDRARGLGLAYRLYAENCALYEQRYGPDHVKTRMVKKRGRENFTDFELAKHCYELICASDHGWEGEAA